MTPKSDVLWLSPLRGPEPRPRSLPTPRALVHPREPQRGASADAWQLAPVSRIPLHFPICFTGGGGSDFKIQIPLIRAGFGLGSELGQSMGCFSLPVAFMFPSCIFPEARLNSSCPGQHAGRAYEPKGRVTRNDVGNDHHGPASSSPVPPQSLHPAPSAGPSGRCSHRGRCVAPSPPEHLGEGEGS